MYNNKFILELLKLMLLKNNLIKNVFRIHRFYLIKSYKYKKKYSFVLQRFIDFGYIVLLLATCKNNNLSNSFKKKSLSIVLPDKNIIKNVKTYSNIEHYEQKILDLIPINNLNLKAIIRNKVVYLDGKPAFNKTESNKRRTTVLNELHISRKICSKELIINKLLASNLAGGIYDNKDVIIKIFGKPNNKNNKRYKAKIAEELTRHIFANAVDKNIAPKIYLITKDEKGNIFLIMEKISFNLKLLRKDPYKWIKTIYQNLLKLHERGLYHTDPQPGNLIGYKLIDFAYQDNGGTFFDDIENKNVDLELKDIRGFAQALFYTIYAWDTESDPILKNIIDSIYASISEEKFLNNPKGQFLNKIYDELKKRKRVDGYAKFLLDIVLDKKHISAKDVLNNLEALK